MYLFLPSGRYRSEFERKQRTVIKRIVCALFLSLFPLSAHGSECVILLHGLARTSSSMNKMEYRLKDEGYLVANVDYPSTKYRIEYLSKVAVDKGLASCSKHASEKIHFVTHSLGGILVRYYLSKSSISNLGRTVMLGPPNKGSEVVDTLRDVPGFTFINGPAGLQLGTGSQSIPKQLGAANFEVGVIAGTKSINLFLSMMIPSTDDGKVSLESAHLEEEKAFMKLPVTHPFMMRNDEVIENVISFLKSGEFVDEREN